MEQRQKIPFCFPVTFFSLFAGRYDTGRFNTTNLLNAILTDNVVDALTDTPEDYNKDFVPKASASRYINGVASVNAKQVIRFINLPDDEKIRRIEKLKILRKTTVVSAFHRFLKKTDIDESDLEELEQLIRETNDVDLYIAEVVGLSMRYADVPQEAIPREMLEGLRREVDLERGDNLFSGPRKKRAERLKLEIPALSETNEMRETYLEMFSQEEYEELQTVWLKLWTRLIETEKKKPGSFSPAVVEDIKKIDLLAFSEFLIAAANWLVRDIYNRWFFILSGKAINARILKEAGLIGETTEAEIPFGELKETDEGIVQETLAFINLNEVGLILRDTNGEKYKRAELSRAAEVIVSLFHGVSTNYGIVRLAEEYRNRGIAARLVDLEREEELGEDPSPETPNYLSLRL